MKVHPQILIDQLDEAQYHLREALKHIKSTASADPNANLHYVNSFIVNRLTTMIDNDHDLLPKGNSIQDWIEYIEESKTR